VKLLCDDNQLSELEVSMNTALVELSCYNNQLSELDVSENPALEGLLCANNQLSELDVSMNTRLEFLYCSDNQLSKLDASMNPALKYLYCNNNQLNELDVSMSTGLKVLNCANNQLIALDLNNTSTDFDGCCQTVLLTLYNNGNGEYELPIALNKPVFNKTAITYVRGNIQSTDTTVTSTDFIVNTNQAGRQLWGIINFTYSTSSNTGVVEGKHADLPLRIYPNPAGNQLIISGVKADNYPPLQIYDVVGQCVGTNLRVCPDDNIIDVSHLAKGMYFLKIDGKVVKFIKE
jgi:hypothetical protein